MKVLNSTFCIFLFTLILAFNTSGQTATSQPDQKAAITEALTTLVKDVSMSQAAIGICVQTASGKTIVQHNSQTMLVPASNMKLLSTGVALHLMGPDYRYKTELGYKGEIQNGVLNGDLYIIGGGDPTIGSKDSIAVNVNTIFSRWEKTLRNAGITKINGYIIGDGRWAEGMQEEESWSWQDIGTYYGTGVSGLNFYENMLSYKATAGEEVGKRVSMIATYPKTPWITIRNEAITGEKGTGDETYLYLTDLAPVGAIRGKYGVDKKPKRVDFSNKYPEYTCAKYFEDWLKEHGIECSKGAADFRLKADEMAKVKADTTQIKTLGSTYSPILKRIIFTTNHASNNLFAEILMKTVGKHVKGSTASDMCRDAMIAALNGMGINTGKGIRLKDGSGLSRQNYVSADFFCRFLIKMMDSPHYQDFLSTLPHPGGEGTLKYNMRSADEELKNRVKVKSGSMNGVRCYSGYILPSEGSGKETLIISVLTNNCTAPSWKSRQLIDKFMETVAKTN